jgi:hypothetical protein
MVVWITLVIAVTAGGRLAAEIRFGPGELSMSDKFL